MEDELHDRRDRSGHNREGEDEESAEGFDPEEDDETECSCGKTEKGRREVTFYVTLITAALGGAVSLSELISSLSNHF